MNHFKREEVKTRGKERREISLLIIVIRVIIFIIKLIINKNIVNNKNKEL
jgi:hypothetical protein